MLQIDVMKAKEIATRFIEQHHSIIIAHANLHDDRWLVTMQIGFLPQQVKKVEIDAKNGRILGCN
jgi:uncharacterized membrane protein YkoI